MQSLPQLIQSGMQIINALTECILQNLPIILSAGIELLYAIINGILNNLDQLIAAAVTLIGELVAGLLENLPILISCALQLIIALAAGLVQAIPQIIAVLPQLIMAIVDGFANTDWSSIGSDIVSGIKDGLLGMKDSLVETAKNIWTSIKNIFSKKITTNVETSTSGSTTPHAAGGVFNKPTLLQSVNGASHLVGEAGAEAILPLDSLWNNMSTMFNPAFGDIGSKLSALADKINQGNNDDKGGDTNSSPSIVYSPQIIIQGNASKQDVEDALEMSQSKFEAMYNKMMKDRQRTRF
jgi:phage-related protein